MEGEASPITAKLRASRRRPPRASRACETCRVRKTKCDQAQPCSYCAYHSLDCVYRNVGSSESHSSIAKRQSRLREVQRDNGRPSPWPEVNLATPQTSRFSRSPDHPTAPLQGANPNARSPAASTIASPGLGDSASTDGLTGVNVHTKGTEFYGTSSNFAFLQNLYARARNQEDAFNSGGPQNGPFPLASTASIERDTSTQLAPEQRREGSSEGNNTTGNKSQLSIVNLLYNPGYPTQSPPQLSGTVDDGYQVRVSSQTMPTPTAHNTIFTIDGISHEAKIEIEKMFISSYFSNKHYIHPMLCKQSFMQRCENQAFKPSKRPAFCHRPSGFSGLYFAVVALGAINASSHETALLDHYCKSSSSSATASPAVLDFADFYFGIAKQALGDIFESCSLESAQALLLLSVFCQNALRPHSCYMYSGMAVRTAVAVGLASGISSLPPTIRKEGIRTWWCIYSHEVEMCCSSGRLNSVKELYYYQVPLPIIQDATTSGDPEAESNDIAMIPSMVSFVQMMFEASHLLYHSSKRSLDEMSQIAMGLDNRLLCWKSSLPSYLDIDASSLNDPEWAFKQKLVLRLRFYFTRNMIHRPFLASASTTVNSIPLQHVHICLGAAQATIQMQYEAFLHRIYFRTWWYNTTYALYAAMILLHLVLSGCPGIQDGELLADVEKSLGIFDSMQNLVVARRCSEMIREVLEVARACAARRQAQSQSSALLVPTSNPPFGAEPGVPDPTTFGLDTTGNSPPGDGNFFFSLFHDEFQPDTRANMLADLVDPTILQNFAFGNGWNDLSSFQFPDTGP
ncbi:fungal-specific transcription factor domain-containing protein [Aspergillus californicus]